MIIEHPPVDDRAKDVDHTDAAWQPDPFPIWDERRLTVRVHV
jgi:hypothetical protein